MPDMSATVLSSAVVRPVEALRKSTEAAEDAVKRVIKTGETLSQCSILFSQVINFIQNSSGHRRRLPLVRARYTGPIDYVGTRRILVQERRGGRAGDRLILST
jgi:hypothetical protein